MAERIIITIKTLERRKREGWEGKRLNEIRKSNDKRTRKRNLINYTNSTKKEIDANKKQR